MNIMNREWGKNQKKNTGKIRKKHGKRGNTERGAKETKETNQQEHDDFGDVHTHKNVPASRPNQISGSLREIDKVLFHLLDKEVIGLTFLAPRLPY